MRHGLLHVPQPDRDDLTLPAGRPVVEVDATYYSPPAEQTARLWAERTPAHFTFNIKAYSLLTNHPTRPDSLYGDIKAELPKDLLDKRRLYRDKLPADAVDEVWERFRLALFPLHSAGKLGAVLFQFPQYFTISRKNKAYIEEAVSRLPDYRIAVEFRHKSWLEDRNVDELAGYLEVLLRDPQLRAKLGQQSRAIASGHELKTTIDRFEVLYHEVVSGRVVPIPRAA